MRANREQKPLGRLSQELARLASAVSSLELRLAGSLDPEANAWLERLCGTSRHLLAAQGALAGVEQSAKDAQTEHLQGSSPSVPIQDLLCFLATAKKSGVLRVQAERELFLLQLSQGAVVYATGDAPPSGESLGDLLAAQGVKTAEVLRQLPSGSGGDWVDPNLVGTSWIARDSLAGAIQRQTRSSFFRLCAAREASFRFYEGAEIENIVPVKQSAMELLLEYSRVLDESGPRAPAPPVLEHQPAMLQLRPRPPGE